MIYRFFQLFVRRTHFWRHIGFAEMAELYTSRMLRVMAMQMMGGFVAVYMYQLGYSLEFIAWYCFGYFSLRVFLAPLVAIIVARYGPKHGTLLSNIGQIAAVIVLLFLQDYGAMVLLIYAPLAGIARSLYDVCYLVDFSKVKHVEHAGKEIGIMQIVERVMTALGPLLGGLVALFFGPQAMLVFGSLLMIIAALPLFFSGEPVRVRQKITLKHFNWKATCKPIIANIATGADIDLSGISWNLFLAIIVLGVTDNAVYAEIGALASIALFASIAVAYIYGKLVDTRHGKTLLKLSVVGDALLHIVRPFVATPVQIVGVNVVNEVATTGYVLPSMRGIFDTADGLPGYRIVYMTIMGATLVVGDCIVMLVLALLVGQVGEHEGLRLLYFILGPFMLLIGLHTTAIYRRGILTKFVHRV